MTVSARIRIFIASSVMKGRRRQVTILHWRRCSPYVDVLAERKFLMPSLGITFQATLAALVTDTIKTAFVTFWRMKGDIWTSAGAAN